MPSVRYRSLRLPWTRRAANDCGWIGAAVHLAPVGDGVIFQVKSQTQLLMINIDVIETILTSAAGPTFFKNISFWTENIFNFDWTYYGDMGETPS